MRDLKIVAMIFLCCFAFVYICDNPPHFMSHHWKWSGQGNFQRDVGASRSASKLGGFGRPNIDYATFDAQMRGRGWNQKCETCDEIRWPRSVSK